MATKTLSTNARIMEAARVEMQRAGAAGVSLRSVAKEANVAPSAVYRHFRNKEALVDAVTSAALERFTQSLWRAIARLPVGSIERLARLGQEYIRFAQTHPADFAVLFTPPAAGPRLISELPGKAGFELLRQCVEEAMDAGVLKRADAAMVSLLLWARVHGIVHLLAALDFGAEAPIARGSEGPAAVFFATSPMIFSGLAAEPQP